MDSILYSVRKKLPGISECEEFDDEIIDDINTSLRRLNELGIGKTGFNITGPDETWSDFCGEYVNNLSQIKTYVHMKVRLMFDPPSTSYLLTHMKNELNEMEWLLESDANSLYNY